MRHFRCGICAAVCLAGLLCAQPAPQLRQAFFGDRLISYQIRGGYAIYQGDIILGTAAEMEAEVGAGGRLAPRSVAINTGRLWPSGVMTYTMDPALTPLQQQWVQAGIDYWNTNTPLHIRPRASESNYVRFVYDPSTEYACSSYVGMIGGSQAIAVTLGCSVGSMIHELGHAFGLLHEQSRADRNAWITVLYQNIDKRYASDFDQRLRSSQEYGYFDYDSVMLYPASGFSRDFQNTIETVPVGIPIGQRNGLSAGDLDAVSRLYGFIPSTTAVTTVPAGLTVTVDGAPAQSPASFPWAPGSTHSIAVDGSIGAADADPRYVFVRWSDGGELAHDITASSKQTVFCAVFQAQHRFSVGVDSSGGGSAAAAPASPDGYYPERQPVRVAATPDGDNQFVRWNGATNLNASGFGGSSSPATVQVASPNRRYTASFTGAPLAIFESQPEGRYVTIDGTTYMTPFRQAWAVGGTHTLGVSATQYAGNDSVRYQFTGWEDGSAQTTRNVTFAGSATYTASFKTQYVLTTSYAGSGDVTVSPASADGYYDAGSTVQVTATPNTGYALLYWLGDLLDSVSPHSLTMDQQRMVIANFGFGAPLAFTPLNAASYRASPESTGTWFTIAPGELLTVFGADIGPDSPIVAQADSQGLMPRSLGGARVLFDSVAAPLVYVGKDQLSAVVPAGVAGKSSTYVTVERNGAAFGKLLSMTVAGTAPAFFTLDGSGAGQIAALNQDNSTNSPSNPAAPGTVIQMWATGAGLMSRPIPDEQVMTDMGALATPVAPVYVRLGNLPAQIQYAGSAPWLVNGVIQVNAWVPNELIGDPAVPVQLIIGDYSSPPGTTIAVN